MGKTTEIHNQLTLSQQLHHAFFSPKGYDPFENLKSHDGDAIYESYLRCNKAIASGITLQNSQISFVSKFNKEL
ncbi:MAG: hypothetical protein CTY19_06580 [Methylomonas sp.]|jgi:hypothetical protein|nr:MAG: hypothetical protein CTY19_06580 [Methylomonas sp.]